MNVDQLPADSGASIRDLAQVGESDVQEFGQKAAILGKMVRHGIRVPSGLCLPHSILQPLCHSVAESGEAEAYSSQVRYRSALSSFVLRNVRLKFGDSWMNATKLVVRSSASVENSVAASFAGIFHSVTAIESESQLVEAIVSCWNSQSASHVRKYMARLGLNGLSIRLGIVIQEMIMGDVSGVVFTRSPITTRNEMLIEATYGLCAPVVQGTCNPDRYWIDLQTSKISIQQIEPTESSEALVESHGYPASTQHGCLEVEEIKEIVRTALSVERLFGCPQDIEWTLKDNELYILQSRPLTSLTGKMTGCRT